MTIKHGLLMAFSMLVKTESPSSVIAEQGKKFLADAYTLITLGYGLDDNMKDLLDAHGDADKVPASPVKKGSEKADALKDEVEKLHANIAALTASLSEKDVTIESLMGDKASLEERLTFSVASLADAVKDSNVEENDGAEG